MRIHVCVYVYYVSFVDCKIIFGSVKIKYFLNAVCTYVLFSYLVDTRKGAWEYSLEVAIASFKPFQ